MGQVALGIRSLLVRVVIFVIMAALLAWALGGTLWPRPETADLEGVVFAGRSWRWKLLVGGGESAPARVRWQLMVTGDDGRPEPFDERFFGEVAPTVVLGDALYFAGRGLASGAGWAIERVDASGRVSVHPMPDRLAVEQQLARLAAGMPLQDGAAIAAQRPEVLDPGIGRSGG